MTIYDRESMGLFENLVRSDATIQLQNTQCFITVASRYGVSHLILFHRETVLSSRMFTAISS